jgi:hypothetical protein
VIIRIISNEGNSAGYGSVKVRENVADIAERIVADMKALPA